MSATITWAIQWMNCKPTEGSYTDVVITAGWICNGSQVNGSDTFNGAVYSTCSFPAPEGTFIPYADLTQAEVLGWCWANGVDKDATEASIQSQINGQINPTVIQPPLPWVTPTV